MSCVGEYFSIYGAPGDPDAVELYLSRIVKATSYPRVKEMRQESTGKAQFGIVLRAYYMSNDDKKQRAVHNPSFPSWHA